MNKMVYKHKNINGMKAGMENRMEGLMLMRAYRENAKHTWLNTKHRTVATALREFIRDYKPESYLLIYQEQTRFYKDDSIEIWYME